MCVCPYSKFSDFDETWYPNVFHDAKSESEVSFPKFEKGGSVGGEEGGNLKKQKSSNLHETWYLNAFWDAKSYY